VVKFRGVDALALDSQGYQNVEPDMAFDDQSNV